MAKIYELTTNSMDGYRKIYVKGIKTDSEANRLAKRGFGKKFYWKSGVSYYDDEPSNYHEKGYWNQRSMTKSQFLKFSKRYK